MINKALTEAGSLESELASLEAHLAEARETFSAALERKQEALTELDELVFQVCQYFRHISKADALWHARVFEGRGQYDLEQRARILDWYTTWAKLASNVLERLRGLGVEPKVVPSWRRLEEDFSEAKSLIEGGDAFFDDPALTDQQSRALGSNESGETLKFEELGD